MIDLVSIGDCPICPGSGALFVLRSLAAGRPAIFFCPLCGVAWPHPPSSKDATLSSLEACAPEGVELPSLDEARSLAPGVDVEIVVDEHWQELLADELQRAYAPDDASDRG